MDELLKVQGHSAIICTEPRHESVIRRSMDVQHKTPADDTSSINQPLEDDALESTIVSEVCDPGAPGDGPKKKTSKTCWVCELEKRDQRTYDMNDVIHLKESKFGTYDERYSPDFKISKSGEIQIASPSSQSSDEISDISDDDVQCQHSEKDDKKVHNSDFSLRTSSGSNLDNDQGSINEPKERQLTNMTEKERKDPSMIKFVLAEIVASLDNDPLGIDYDSDPRYAKSVGSVNATKGKGKEKKSELKTQSLHALPKNDVAKSVDSDPGSDPGLCKSISTNAVLSDEEICSDSSKTRTESLYNKAEIDDGFKHLQPPVERRARDSVTCSIINTGVSGDFLPIVDM